MLLVQEVLATHDFAARDFATRELFEGFKSLVLAAHILVLAIFFLIRNLNFCIMRFEFPTFRKNKVTQSLRNQVPL